MSEPSTTDRDRIEKLADSFMSSYRAGQRPSIDLYVQQYPELAGQLRDLITALVVLERNAPQRNRLDVVDKVSHTAPPREIGEFSIIREIGRGGMGVVYEAIQQSLGRHVALKVLSTPGLLNPTQLERFRLEARSAGRLHHSNIVPVFGVGDQDGAHYYAMQFIAGQSLDQVIDALRKVRAGGGRDEATAPTTDDPAESVATGMLSGQYAGDSLPEQRVTNGAEALEAPGDKAPEAVGDTSAAAKHSVTRQLSTGSSGRPFYESVARVGLQVAEALAYAHGEGILHRDIKPSNLLVDRNGNAWITDFGLVKAEDAKPLTETGDFVGTLRYMAPERLDGWSDPRSDIYGLGATLYELLTQRTFLEVASRGELLDHIRYKQPEAPTKIDAKIPRDLETIVLKALSKEPFSRYHTAEEMAEDLRRFLADRPILARRSTLREQLVRWSRRNPLVATLSAIATVALLAGTIGSTWQAVRATRAERLAEARLRTEQDARRRAHAAQLAADHARTAEAEQRALAEQNYQRARATVDRYFTLVSESRLLNVPGLQPLRKELLESANEFYRTAADSRTNDASHLADRAAAALRLSAVYASMGQVDDGIAAVQSGLKLVSELRGRPDSAQYLPRVAGFWSGTRWWRDATKASTNALVATATLYQLESTWRQLAKEFPQEPRFQRDLSAVQGIIATHLQSAAFAAKARDTAATLVREHPHELEYGEELVFTTMLLARFTKNGFDEQLRLTDEAVNLTEQMVADHPDSSVAKWALGRALTGLGVAARHEQPKRAEAALRRSVEIFDALVDDAPEENSMHTLFADSVGEWVLCPPADISTPQARLWVNQAIAELEIRVRRRPNDRYGKQMLALLHHQVADRQTPLRDADATQGEHQRRALSLFTELAAAFPDHAMHSAYVEQVGWTNSRLAGLAKIGNRTDEAASHLVAAAAAFAKLADNPQVEPRGGAYRGWEIDARWDLGQILVAEGKTREAEDVARQYVDAAVKLVEEYPANPQYQQKLSSGLSFLAGILRMAGRSDDVDDVYRQATLRLIEHIDQRQTAQYLGKLLRDAGQLDVGIAACDQLLARDRGNAAAWALRGSCQMWKRDYAAMADDYTKAIEQQPNEWRYWSERAFAYLRMGEHNKAIADHTKAIEISGQDAAQWLRRGESYQAIARYEDAEADYTMAIELNAAHWENWLTRGRLFAECGKMQEAEADFAKAVELCPNDAQSLNHFAWDLASPTRPTTLAAKFAVKMAQRAVDLAPDDPSVLNTLGTAQYRVGEWQKAIDLLLKAEGLAPGRSLGFNGLFLAMAYAKLGHQDDARKWFDQSIEWLATNRSHNPELIRFRAEAEQLLGISAASE